MFPGRLRLTAGAANRRGIKGGCRTRQVIAVGEASPGPVRGTDRHRPGGPHRGHDGGIGCLVRCPGIAAAAGHRETLPADSDLDARLGCHLARKPEMHLPANVSFWPGADRGIRAVITLLSARCSLGDCVATRHQRIAERAPTGKHPQAIARCEWGGGENEQAQAQQEQSWPLGRQGPIDGWSTKWGCDLVRHLGVKRYRVRPR